MRSLPAGLWRNFQSNCASVRGACGNDFAKSSRIAASSPERYGRVSTSMRRFDGANGANVRRRAGAALRDDANRAGTDEQRIGQHAHRGGRDVAEERGARAENVAEELLVVIVELGADAVDLETGTLEQLDKRGARVEN